MLTFVGRMYDPEVFMTVLGFWVTVFGFAASAVSAFMYYRETRKPGAIQVARRWMLMSVLAVVLDAVLLVVLLLRHDYSNGYVYSYSSSSLPLYLLLSSFYAGQEGSFLFWALCSVLGALVLARHARRIGVEARVMTVFMSVQAFLLLLVMAKSPFRTVWEMIPQMPPNQIPAEGRGLNPLLQNFWMAIHPPVLFIGFAAMAAPFSFALAGLWKRNYALLVQQGLPWVLLATLVLGIGIMLGAYWAYGVLGWGGYWGWDPVENSSLVPWLTGMALIHTVLASRRSGAYLRTSLVLAIGSFLLVVYSTFLTRSGILGDASVHSFVDPGAGVYWLLVLFVAAIAVTGFGLLFARWKELLPQQKQAGGLNRETMLGVGALALVLAALVVLFGTSLPIFSRRTVEPAFYDTTTLPLAIGIALLIGYSLYTQWGLSDVREMIRRSLRVLVVSAVATGVLYWFGVRHAGMVLFVFASVFALAVNIELAWKIRKGNFLYLGGKFAHLGLAIFFLGVISTGKYSTKEELALQLNTPRTALGYTFTYRGNKPTPDGKYKFDVAVEKEGTRINLAPVMFEAGEQGIMRTPDIASSFEHDIYLSPLSLEEGTANPGSEAYTIPKGDSVRIGGVTARFLRFDMDQHGSEGMTAAQGVMAIGSVLELSDGTSRETITPVAIYGANGSPVYKPTPSRLMNADIRLVSMNVGMGATPSTITVEVQRAGVTPAGGETLKVEASVKPFVNLLWGGTILMFAGCVLSLVRRVKE